MKFLFKFNGKNKNENSNLVSDSKSSLPNDSAPSSNNDLDDEIPF